MDNSDADLVTTGITEPIEIKTAIGTRTQNWFYPGRQDCLTCHTIASGGVLGLKTRQLNGSFDYPNGVTANQLHTLGHLKIFDAAFDDRKIFHYPRLVNVTNSSAALQLRVRSYLDANCAMCHRPGSAGAFFDARFDTPLKKQNLINGAVANQLGISGAKVIVPGDTNKSILFQRVSIVGEGQMPPLARNLIDDKAVAVIGKWISSLPVAVASLPRGWSSTDVGNVGVSGEADYLNGNFNLLASGSDIWESADAFHFASRALNGDGSIVARVVSVQYTDPWAKAGVMLRENDSAGSKYVFLGVTGQGGSVLQSRAAADGASASADDPATKLPQWLKLARCGNIFSSYVSADGTNWIAAGSVTNALNKKLSVGLAVTAHNNSVLNSTLFDHVTVKP
jgi:mono/diheme cytochrome c family protein/regulation of enolase protein 1 (concanavalin A-like superfamily)